MVQGKGPKQRSKGAGRAGAGPRQALKEVLVARGIAPNCLRAEALIIAGDVRVNGEPVSKSGQLVPVDASVEVRASDPYVSRSAQKLLGGLDLWGLSPEGRICADVGSSTGGFTQVLLERGAARVFAIDVGQNELAWKLRNDPRVVSMERTNARSLDKLPDPIGFASIDVSFISCSVLLPVMVSWFGGEGGDIAVLIKPQFEARREEVPAGGVVTDRSVHVRVLEQVLIDSLPTNCEVRGLIAASPKGQSGNQEYLAWLEVRAGEPSTKQSPEVPALIEAATRLNNSG